MRHKPFREAEYLKGFLGDIKKLSRKPMITFCDQMDLSFPSGPIMISLKYFLHPLKASPQIVEGEGEDRGKEKSC